MIIAGTGHTSVRLPGEEGTRFRINMKLKSIPKKNIEYVITGMSEGFDLFFADEALKLKIPVVVARPWEGHPSPVGQEVLYANILEKAKSVYNVEMGLKYPGDHIFKKRDIWMIDNCTHLLAYFDGIEDDSGTYHTYKYAKEQEKVKVYNLIQDPPF